MKYTIVSITINHFQYFNYKNKIPSFPFRRWDITRYSWINATSHDCCRLRTSRDKTNNKYVPSCLWWCIFQMSRIHDDSFLWRSYPPSRLIGSYTSPYWRSGFCSTSVRNSVFAQVERVNVAHVNVMFTTQNITTPRAMQ